MSGWGCPHYVNERCRLMNCECDPGKKGCVLYGSFTFAPPPPPPPEEDEEEKDHETKQREGEKPKRFR